MLEQEDRDRLIRIDERTATLVDDFKDHLSANRDDFRNVHGRINSVSSKQNIILGIGAGVGAVFTISFAWVKGIIGVQS